MVLQQLDQQWNIIEHFTDFWKGDIILKMYSVMFITVYHFLVHLQFPSLPLWQIYALFLFAVCRSVNIMSDLIYGQTLSILFGYFEFSWETIWLLMFFVFLSSLRHQVIRTSMFSYSAWQLEMLHGWKNKNFSRTIEVWPLAYSQLVMATGSDHLLSFAEINVVSHSLCIPLTQPYLVVEDLCGYVHKVLGEHFLSGMYFAACA